jgi:hypothetical protein
VKIKLRSKTVDSAPTNRTCALPTIRSQSTRSRDLNKYYIAPNLRYKNLRLPTHGPENSDDETYIYRNLHNKSFWERPLSLSNDTAIIKRELTDKTNVPALRRFKQYMEQRGNKRIPMIIRELLSQQAEHEKAPQ